MTLVDPLEGKALSGETIRELDSWYFKNTGRHGQGVLGLQKTVSVRGGAAPGMKGALMEGGMIAYVGYEGFDWYMNQGEVWDSYDQSWKPYGQWKEEHIYNNLPSWLKNTWAKGSRWMEENEFGADVLTYGPVQGPTIFVGDWVKRKFSSFLDRLNKK